MEHNWFCHPSGVSVGPFGLVKLFGFRLFQTCSPLALHRLLFSICDNCVRLIKINVVLSGG
jgi:hypothetical protein